MIVTKTMSRVDQQRKNTSLRSGWRMTPSSGGGSIPSEMTLEEIESPSSTSRCGCDHVIATYTSRYEQQNTLSATPARTLRSRNSTPVGSDPLDTTRVNRPLRRIPDPGCGRIRRYTE